MLQNQLSPSSFALGIELWLPSLQGGHFHSLGPITPSKPSSFDMSSET